MKTFFLIFFFIAFSFYTKSQPKHCSNNSFYISYTDLFDLKNLYYASTKEYTVNFNRVIYNKIMLNISYSFWDRNQFKSPQVSDYYIAKPKFGDINFRYNYQFFELGPSFLFLNYRTFKISILPNISYVYGFNRRTIYFVHTGPHSTFSGYTLKENKIGISLKGKADIKIKKDRFNIGINGGYRYFSRYNYNSTKGYIQINFGIHAGINF